MGAQSDFIGEQFVPSEQYKAQQMAMVQKLVAAGVDSEQLEQMFFIPVGSLRVGSREMRSQRICDGSFVGFAMLA
jgi:hypothetical protein